MTSSTPTSPSRARPRWAVFGAGPSLREQALTLALAAVAATITTVSLVTMLSTSPPQQMAVIWLTLLLFIVALTFSISITRRDDRTVELPALTLIAALASAQMEPQAVIILAALAAAIAAVIQMSAVTPRTTPVGYVQDTTVTILATTVIVTVIASTGESFVGTLTAAVAGAVTAGLARASYRYTARPGRRFLSLLPPPLETVILPLVAASIAMSILVVATPNGRTAALGVPAVILGGYKMVGFLTAASATRRAFTALDQASADLVRLRHEPDVAAKLLTVTSDMFNADRVEVELVTGQTGTTYYLDRGPQTVRTHPTPTDRVSRIGQAPRLAALSARLTRHGATIGRVNVYGRDVTKVGMGHQILRAFAHTAEGVIMTARMYQDLEERRARSEHDASHDAATGLPNRAWLYRQDRAGAHPAGSLLLLDLDGFKRINDTLGHATGDRVLVEVADRLRSLATGTDIPIRLGGDEFAILTGPGTDPDHATKLARQVADVLTAPIIVDGLPLPVEASVGIAHASPGTSLDELLKQADTAMYQAKRDGRGEYVEYSTRIDPNDPERLALAGELPAAVAAGQIVLHYQPQVSTRTGSTVGFEALARWDHPVLGLVGPDRFVPLAEYSHAIKPFTRSLLQDALTARAVLRDRGMAEATVSVNLSARAVLDANLVEDVQALLSRAGVPASDLVVEVTETARPPVEGPGTIRVLDGLAGLGCRVAVDDFGSGYASLVSILSRPVGEVKVDRQFTSLMLTDQRAYAAVCAAVALGRSLGAVVVGEGVEDQATYDELARIGCDVVQGWFVAAAMPFEDLTGWLAARGEIAPVRGDREMTMRE